MNFLDRLDNYYYSKKPNEVWLIVILVSVLIGYLLYTLLSPMASDYRNYQESRNVELTNSIDEANNFLRTITVNGDRDYMVKQLNKKIVQKRVELNSYRAKLAKLSGAIRNLNEVLYTKDNWSKFLHNIAVKAKDNNLQVSTISNEILDKNGTFGKVLDINIKCKGEYSDILSFMNDLETTKLVANITNVKLKASEIAPQADINLTVWGLRP